MWAGEYEVGTPWAQYPNTASPELEEWMAQKRASLVHYKDADTGEIKEKN